ncbi:hypothetical protein [Curtobacterium sp. MCJR17_020]|uniref:hypothetical protein n=1 Tax=Curtobacterium sp. MCJR17_020 TaxID=2175619 RepID=UPI000DA8C016|nr:hypothetical protein [Curtobacterium sp. MCJR17_020]WIE71865.1 hypothetical protein DEJ14_017055 [Curtobacterium sp. MCJR17_020]
MGRTRIVVGVVGTLVVTLYAGLLALNALVLDPLGAVPGLSLGAIYGHLDAQGYQVRADVVAVLVIAAVGIALAVTVLIVTLVRRTTAHVAAAWLLAIVAAGAVQVFGSGFQLGMDVADGYGIGGGDHTIWAGVLYVTSLVALLAIPVVLVVGERGRGRTVAGTLAA